MQRAMRVFLILVMGTFGFAAWAGELSPEAFLGQVRNQNEEVKGAIDSSEGSLKRSEAASLALSWSLFLNGAYKSDARLYPVPLMSYTSIETQNYSLGFRKLTSFGMEAKVGYSLMHTDYRNLVVGGTPSPLAFFDTTPFIELKQSLWSNGFGRATQADQESAQAMMLESRFRSRQQARSLLIRAEEAYWQLALIRERIEVSKRALEQAEKIYKWAKQRSERNLADDVDALQAEAALELRRLEVQTALDDERAASRALNKMRNIDSDVVEDTLVEVKSDTLLGFKAPDIKPERDDVKMAEFQQKAAMARAASAAEQYRPTLDVYGNYALNGRANNASQALGNPFQAGRPTWEVGLRFNMPLDRGIASEAIAGANLEQQAAEMILRQKQRDQQQDWLDLQRRIADLQKRLQLSQTLVNVQKTKLQKERERLNAGRTTTFQVLSFEQDFAQSRIAEIGAKNALIQAITQVKQYGGVL